MAYLDDTGLAYFWGKLKAWIASAASNLVHRTGHEAISGRKIFNASQYYDAESGHNILTDRPIIRTLDFARGDAAPSSNKYISLDFVDNTYNVDMPWEGNSRLAGINYIYRTSGERVFACTLLSSQGAGTDLIVGRDASDVAFASAPSTSSQRNNGTDIVTRDWIPNDTRLVHTTGNEEIAGIKTFTDEINCNKAGTFIRVKNPNLTKGTYPASTTNFYFPWCDKDGNRLGVFETIVRDQGETLTRIYAYKNEAGSENAALLEVNYPVSGAPYALCPSTPDPTPANLNSRVFNQSGGTDILTRDWIPRDTRIVHANTAFESMTGNLLIANSSNPRVISSITNTVKGTTPSNSMFGGFYVLDSTASTASTAENKRYGIFETAIYSDGNVVARIRAYKPEASSIAHADLSVIYPLSGDPYTEAPTPDIGDNSTKIATTAWAFPRICKYIYLAATDTVDLNDYTTPGVYQFVNNNNATFLNVPEGTTGTLFVIGAPNHVVRQMWFRWGTNNSNDHRVFIRQYVSGASTAWSSWTRLFTDKDTIPVANGGTGQTSVANIQAGKDGNGNTISSTYLPLSGGTMSGSITRSGGLAQSGSTSDSIFICNGTNASGGGGIWLYGKDNNAHGEVRIQAYNGTYRQLNCLSDGTLKWNGQTVQTTSDERLKTPMSDVPDDVLDAWGGVRWGQFQFLDAVDEKGSSARLHVGLIAQAVDRTFASENLDVCRYGILCHEVRDAEGEVPAVEQWMARYTEALCMEAAYQRREKSRLKKRVADLEERLAALELKIS